jgi:phage-related protein
MRYEIVLLEPAQEFISGLRAKLKAKTLRTIELLAEFGPYLSMPHSRKLSGYEIWEIRVSQGSDICRLFYFYHTQMGYIITSGYLKKTDRTSKREIEKADRLRIQFLAEEDT